MLELIEFAAVITSAIYGLFRAARNHLDVVGFITMACAVAFGGGTLRDLFLDRHPLFWIANDEYLVLVFFLGIIGAAMPGRLMRIERFLPYPDALALGLYCVTGAGFALEMGASFFVAALLGVVTGTFGGVIADVICNEIPSLFRKSPLYATCAFVGAWVYLWATTWPVPQAVPFVLGIAVTMGLRLAALRWQIVIPTAGPAGGPPDAG